MTLTHIHPQPVTLIQPHKIDQMQRHQVSTLFQTLLLSWLKKTQDWNSRLLFMLEEGGLSGSMPMSINRLGLNKSILKHTSKKDSIEPMNQVREKKKLLIIGTENKNLMIWILENKTFRPIHVHCS